MTFPFGFDDLNYLNSQLIPDGGDSTIDQGITGTAGGGTLSTQSTAPLSPSPTDEGRSTIRCCGRSTGNICVDIPNATACPRGTAECEVAGASCTSPTPTPTPTPPSCLTEGSTCAENGSVIGTCCAGSTCTELTTSLSVCIGTQVNCNYADRTTACSNLPGFANYTGTATRTVLVTDSNGAPLPLGCKQTPEIATDWNTSECVAVPVNCNYADRTTACSNLPGLTGYTGTATRTVLVTDTQNRPLPLGCVQTPGVATDWNTSECVAPSNCETEQVNVACSDVPVNVRGTKTEGTAKQTRPKKVNGQNTPVGCIEQETTYDITTCSTPVGECNTTTETKACNQLLGFTNYIGNASRTVVSRDAQNRPLPLGCSIPNNVPSEWDTSTCTLPGTCETEQIDVACSNVPVNVRGTRTEGTAKQIRLKKVNGQNTPAGCSEPDTVGRYDVTGCTVPQETCETEQVDVACSNVPASIRGTRTLGTAKKTVLRKTANGENIPTGCIVPDTIDTYNINACTTPGPTACDTTGDSTACSNLEGFVNYTGTATRRISAGTPTGCDATGLPTAWDTSACIAPQTHRICGDPTRRTGTFPAGFVEDTDQYSGKCYREVIPPPTYRLCGSPQTYEGQPPLEHVEAQDQYPGLCYQPRPRWRSCIDGNLRDGTPPSDHVQRIYTGAGAGICWEPNSVVGFEPNLVNAFNFIYKRGTSQYPSAVRVRASNPSYAITYRVKLETNDKIKLNDGDGILSFTLPPRGTYDFTLNVSPELYEQLGDGDSRLSLNVEIE